MGKMILNGKEYAGSGSEEHEYSTDEKVVGKWIDGKPIYERVIDVENFSYGSWRESSNGKSVSIPYIESVVDLVGYIRKGNYWFPFNNNVGYVTGGTSWNTGLWFRVDSNTGLVFDYYMGNSYNPATWRLIVKYTKTTDT